MIENRMYSLLSKEGNSHLEKSSCVRVSCFAVRTIENYKSKYVKSSLFSLVLFICSQQETKW